MCETFQLVPIHFWRWVKVDWSGRWTQQWAAEGVFEIIRPAFETELWLVKQFAHSCNLPGWHCTCLYCICLWIQLSCFLASVIDCFDYKCNPYWVTRYIWFVHCLWSIYTVMMIACIGRINIWRFTTTHLQHLHSRLHGKLLLLLPVKYIKQIHCCWHIHWKPRL